MGKIISRTNPSGTTVYGIRWVDEVGSYRRQFDRTWNKERARTELSKVESKLRDGVATHTTMTVAELFAEWHTNYVRVNCSPAYVLDTQRQYRLRIEPIIGHRCIDTVTRRLVRMMVAQMQTVARSGDPANEFAGHRSINKTLTTLSSMFSYALQIDLLSSNPVHGVRELVEQPTRRIDAWPLPVIAMVAQEARRLETTLHSFQRTQRPTWAGQRDFLLIMVAAMTGLRQSELLGLHWDNVDEVGGWIHLTHKLCRVSCSRREPKSRRGRRRVPLLGPAAELLGQWRAVGAHETIVFPNSSSSGYYRACHFDRRVWDRARTAVGEVEHHGVTYDCASLTFHEIRHSFVSACLAQGRDVWEVANWAGDDPEMVKRVYGHYIPGSLGDTSRIDGAFNDAFRT